MISMPSPNARIVMTTFFHFEFYWIFEQLRRFDVTVRFRRTTCKIG